MSAAVQDSSEIAERLLSHDRTALSRLISWAENRDPRFPAALAKAWPRVGRAWRLGITGPPGAGKSTLVSALLTALRARSETVGVLAIDPSSPFSGGALLGDRIRMDERTADAGVYIRSMASRRAHGGLASAAFDACDVMDAFGFDWIVMETVGVGQAEYDVVGVADTVLVVLCPGAGDGIQAMKAGILEVADVLIVNKSDLPGADQLVSDLEDSLELRRIHREERADEWKVPVVAVGAREASGLDDVLEAVAAHRAHLERGDLAERRLQKRAEQVRRMVLTCLEERLRDDAGVGARVDSSLRSAVPPYDVAREILGEIHGAIGAATAREEVNP